MSDPFHIHEFMQADGPHRPVPKVLAAMIDSLPRHMEIRAVAINGQTGDIVVELLHEGMEVRYEFNLHAKQKGPNP